VKRTIGVIASLILAIAVSAPAVLAQQGSNFNRLTTIRHEAGGYATRLGKSAAESQSALVESSFRGGFQADPLRPYTLQSSAAVTSQHPGSTWHSEPQRTLPSAPPPARVIQHSYYPSMRAGQYTNRNIAGRGHCTHSRAGFVAGGGMNAISFGQTHR
jgi:hypothetical protein